MAKYTVPTVYFQPTLDARTAVEVTHFKSLSWANKTNNNGSFELITPMFVNSGFTPKLNGYIRLSPGNTIMQVEKLEKQCDRQGNFWYKMNGRPTQQEDEIVREAKNLGYYFRYVYNGSNAESYKTYTPGTPKRMINSRDLLESSTYEDNLGGFTEIIEDTVHEAYTWGTIITGQPRVIVNTVDRILEFRDRIPNDAMTSWEVYDVRAGMEIRSTGFYKTHEPFTTDNIPEIKVGEASGALGKMERINYNGSWVRNDVTNDIWVYGNGFVKWRTYRSKTSWTDWTWFGGGVGQQRTITVKTPPEYLAEMNALLTPESSGAKPADIRRTITHVEGGHAGYAFAIKAKGDVESRYKVDYNLGDTVSVNDTRLGLIYTGVVSGATETIDSSGYNVDIEIGVMGATVEQRLNRVI